MMSFVRTILEGKLPSISRAAEVRFSLRYPDKCRWFQASLDSDEVRGKLASIMFLGTSSTYMSVYYRTQRGPGESVPMIHTIGTIRTEAVHMNNLNLF